MTSLAVTSCAYRPADGDEGPSNWQTVSGRWRRKDRSGRQPEAERTAQTRSLWSWFPRELADRRETPAHTVERRLPGDAADGEGCCRGGSVDRRAATAARWRPARREFDVDSRWCARESDEQSPHIWNEAVHKPVDVLLSRGNQLLVHLEKYFWEIHDVANECFDYYYLIAQSLMLLYKGEEWESRIKFFILCTFVLCALFTITVSKNRTSANLYHFHTFAVQAAVVVCGSTAAENSMKPQIHEPRVSATSVHAAFARQKNPGCNCTQSQTA